MNESTPPPDSDAAELRAFLADRDVGCPGCGYNLRGLAGGVCPECNQGLDLRVGLSEPHLGTYLGAISGLLGGASLAVVFFVTVTLVSVFEKDWPTGREFWVIVVIPAVMALTEAPLAVVLARVPGRVWFRRQPKTSRIWLVGGCWLLTACFVGLFLTLMFRWI